MFQLFEKVSSHCSKLVTESYSTSFSMGIKSLHKRFHEPIYGIYGFVRFADEIVDTFHDFNKRELLQRFHKDTFRAIDEGISLNPILHSFQKVVREYGIERDLIEAFFHSMEMDLYTETYGQKEDYNEYIYGSAEVVGLMCLRVFCEGDQALYDSLRDPARRLGAAFQKVNFLRDMKSDFEERGRVYFPGVDFNRFTNTDKQLIEEEIERDFREAYKGIMRLPEGAKSGVHLAYVYYIKLFKKIKGVPAMRIKESRIRVSNPRKILLLAKSMVSNAMGLL